MKKTCTVRKSSRESSHDISEANLLQQPIKATDKPTDKLIHRVYSYWSGKFKSSMYLKKQCLNQISPIQ